MSSIVKEASYLHLAKQQSSIQSHSLRRLFEEDTQRAERFSLEMPGLFYDFSKNHITPETFQSLCQYASDKGLSHKIHALISGERVNNTEDRAALHTALRQQNTPKTQEEYLVADAQEKMAQCVETLHKGQWLGFSGQAITTVVNIGIGGSDLGPRMVVQALSDYQKNIEVRFSANIDGADLSDTLTDLNPETTLFIIASKTFTTLETLENAKSARQWILDGGCQENQLAQHFIAISTNKNGAMNFGIKNDNIFPMWDWVGGRYSLWSAIGLPIAISIGMENYLELLQGANQMDQHYQEQPIEKNIPAIAALLSFWYSQFWGTTAHAILPYAQRLSRFPSYLQQLDMESLGKSVTFDGQGVDYTTGSIIWGTEGTNGQHSFHQLLHQGTQLIPVDFIAVKHSMSPLTKQHQYLQACCISQSQALLQGKTLADAKAELNQQGYSEEDIDRLAPHKVVAGNKPSSTLIIDELSPKNLGQLIALYEHKVHAMGVLLDINPFDQWGVELGKQLGKPIHQALCEGVADERWDSSTKTLITKLSS